MGRELGQAGWHISARSNGANTCVEVRIDGSSVVVRNSTDPHGPSVTAAASTWLNLLDCVAAGLADYSVLALEPAAGAESTTSRLQGACSRHFVVSIGSGGLVQLACGDDAVRFTRAEWEVFVGGVTFDSEFTLEWLLQAPSIA